MPALVAGIHVLKRRKAWMAGTSPGHDEKVPQHDARSFPKA
jgi:hypothetical protein